jgi:hypothetical protein
MEGCMVRVLHVEDRRGWREALNVQDRYRVHIIERAMCNDWDPVAHSKESYYSHAKRMPVKLSCCGRS